MLRTASRSSIVFPSSCRTVLRSRRALRCIRGRTLEPTAFAGSSTPDNKKEMFSVRLALSPLHPGLEPDRKLLVSLEHSRRLLSTTDRGSEKQGPKEGGQVPGNVERTLLLNGKGHENEEDPADKASQRLREILKHLQYPLPFAVPSDFVLCVLHSVLVVTSFVASFDSLLCSSMVEVLTSWQLVPPGSMRNRRTV